MSYLSKKLLTGALLAGLFGAHTARADGKPWFGISTVIQGSDINAADNPFVQPQDPALAGNGRDQTLQFGDVLEGGRRDSLMIGGLGTDVIAGSRGSDVILGGLEHFNPSNRDRAFGANGDDIFVWKPGDGSDLFNGGDGYDVVVFGVVGEDAGGFPEFAVVNDQVRGEVFIDPSTGLPQVDLTNSPGFCEIVDESTSADADAQLTALDLDRLVRFSIRGVRDAFEAGVQDTDNGLRVSLHLKSVEFVVCTSRSGGEIEIFDMTESPAVQVSLTDIPSKKVKARLESMVR